MLMLNEVNEKKYIIHYPRKKNPYINYKCV